MFEGKSVRESVIELRQVDPNRSASDMARVIGCSRERVRQILKSLDLPTTSGAYRVQYFCQNRECGREMTGSGRTTRKYCDKTCHSKACRTKVICAECGTAKFVTNSQYKYKMAHGQKVWYCGRACLGKWLGREHGSGVQYAQRRKETEGFSWRRFLKMQ